MYRITVWGPISGGRELSERGEKCQQLTDHLERDDGWTAAKRKEKGFQLRYKMRIWISFLIACFLHQLKAFWRSLNFSVSLLSFSKSP